MQQAERPTQYCSPKAFEETYVNSGRCLSDTDIRLVAEEVVGRNARKLKQLGDVDAMIGMLSQRLGPDMSAWADHVDLKDRREIRDKLKRRFRPKYPRKWMDKPSTWLNTGDITRVMKQYELSDRHFKFLGVYPRDFTSRIHNMKVCMAGEHVCDLDVDSLWKNKRYHIGIVLNTDTHDRDGSHWVACFISINPNKPMYGAYYYDSSSHPPPQEVFEWMLHVRKKVEQSRFIVKSEEAYRHSFEIAHNHERRQFRNTECGMFAIHFLTTAKQNATTFRELCNAMGYDDDMFALRKVLFRP